MMIRKWNYEKHVYEPYEIPYRNICTYAVDMDTPCQCAACGKGILFGDGYTSKVLHTETGFGYAVCFDCHIEEMVEKEKYKNKGD